MKHQYIEGYAPIERSTKFQIFMQKKRGTVGSTSISNLTYLRLRQERETHTRIKAMIVFGQRLEFCGRILHQLPDPLPRVVPTEKRGGKRGI